MKVFSFCLYGTEPNYYTGLLDNIKLIREFFPEFEIFVYRGVCDPTWVLPEGVTVIETHCEGAANMLHRYRPLHDVESGFVRDADSRITERDRWAIQDFLECPQSYHMIRDHIWHKSRLMGGLFGWKKPVGLEIEISADAGYGYDEDYLSSVLYPRIASDLLVHTNLYAFPGEHSRRLPEMKDPTDFVGNVIWNGVPRFTSTPNLVKVVAALENHDQHALVKWLRGSRGTAVHSLRGSNQLLHDSLHCQFLPRRRCQGAILVGAV
jgi:protein O-GlcNAc transferase